MRVPLFVPWAAFQHHTLADGLMHAWMPAVCLLMQHIYLLGQGTHQLRLLPGTAIHVQALLSIVWVVTQALKANPERAPKELKANANYISRFGQTALNDALDMVYDVSGGREITITL